MQQGDAEPQWNPLWKHMSNTSRRGVCRRPLKDHHQTPANTVCIRDKLQRNYLKAWLGHPWAEGGSCRFGATLRLGWVGGTSYPKQAELDLWDPWGSSPLEGCMWLRAHGWLCICSLCVLPPQGFGALESFLRYRELSLLCREGQIAQTGAGFCSCSLLLNSIFLSVFDCVFLPHLLLLYMICQYWVSSHCILLSLNVSSSSLMVPPFTMAFSSGLVWLKLKRPEWYLKVVNLVLSIYYKAHYLYQLHSLGTFKANVIFP